MGRENVAITKLMHVKERKNGNPHGGMYDCIKYIIDPEKTENYWIGGNAGTKTDQVYQNFMETKRDFQKLDGRQCYHFVISFRPGETDPVTAYNVAQEFCEKYLGNYQYIFAVHTDHEHLHAHIVFNSVSIVDGIKYHYADGDWKKYIQPVTDSITAKYGLSPLTYEEKRKGMDYGAWLASKTKMGSLQEDIDYAIKHAATYQQFFMIMEKNTKYAAVIHKNGSPNTLPSKMIRCRVGFEVTRWGKLIRWTPSNKGSP
ncbi:MAG: relaxase/mobilization nuclease domain-containing protein [Lacrimispora saccharolytica]